MIANATPKGSFVVVEVQHTYRTVFAGALCGYVKYYPAIVTKASKEGKAKAVQTATCAMAIAGPCTVLAIPSDKLAGKNPSDLLASLEPEYDDIPAVRDAILSAVTR